MRYKVVLTFESVDELLKCDHASVAVLSLCAICFSRKRFLFNFAACYFPKDRFKLSNEEGLFENKNKQLTKDCFTYNVHGISTVILSLRSFVSVLLFF